MCFTLWEGLLMNGFNTYIGARYVPIFDGEWTNTKKYEPLTIVTYQGNSYTSRSYVPIGIDISNNDYWALTGNFNGQIEGVYEQINNINSILNNYRNIVSYEYVTAEQLTQLSERTLVLVNFNKTYTIPENTVFPNNIDFYFMGGIFAGNFSINGTIYAGRYQIFSSQANITVSSAKNDVGYPEWFGATPNINTVDSAPAINNCVKTFYVTSFAVGNYYIGSSININNSNRKLIGQMLSGDFTVNIANCSRLVAVNNIDAVVSSTSDSSRAHIYLQNFVITNENPDFTLSTSGVKFTNIRGYTIDHVVVVNFNHGFYLDGAILAYLNKCRYLCNKTIEAVNPLCTGIYIGQTSITGGNISPTASLYINNCDLHFNHPAPNDYGIISEGANGLADLYLVENNFYKCYNGIYLKGSSTNVMQQDIFIALNCIDNSVQPLTIDGNLKANIFENWCSMGAYSAITMRGIYINNCTNEGCISVIGNTIKTSNTATNDNFGIRIVNSKGILATNNQIINAKYPTRISSCNNIKYSSSINNSVSDTTTNMVEVEGSSNVYIDITSSGKNKYLNGVHVLSSCSYVQVNVNGIGDQVTDDKVVIAAVPATNADCFKVLANNNTIISPVE